MPERTDRPHRWAALQPAGAAVTQVPLFEVPEREIGRGEFRGLEFVHVRARRIVNEVPDRSPVPFRFTINAYRGCSHACTYCFARPTHAYLDLDPSTEFDRVIVVKTNAVERLRAELHPKRWRGDAIAMGTNTDPYQRAEGKYRLTRGIIEVLGEHRNPFSILTKGTLILRDLDALTDAASRTDVQTSFSIGTLDEDVWRATEPGTPHPMKRVEAVARLNEAGIPCNVLVAPVLPGLSDRRDQLDAVVRACVDAGARSISGVLLHLRPGVREHYLGWLAGHRPDLVDAHERRYRRAYAPGDERAALAATIDDLVAEHRAARRTSGRKTPARPAARDVS
ncbi:MAG TPA: radical SAM protein [Acidimicrobiia bacterium]|nr:radical SAM protein [Acidimicrobiia bacterium]